MHVPQPRCEVPPQTSWHRPDPIVYASKSSFLLLVWARGVSPKTRCLGTHLAASVYALGLLHHSLLQGTERVFRPGIAAPRCDSGVRLKTKHMSVTNLRCEEQTPLMHRFQLTMCAAPSMHVKMDSAQKKKRSHRPRRQTFRRSHGATNA